MAKFAHPTGNGVGTLEDPYSLTDAFTEGSVDRW